MIQSFKESLKDWLAGLVCLNNSIFDWICSVQTALAEFCMHSVKQECAKPFNAVMKISLDFPRIESRIFIKKDLYYESNGKYLSYIIYKFEYIRIYSNHK